MLTEAQRENLIERINDMDLVCPEQVCDMVLACDTIEAAEAQLAECVASDADERSIIDCDGIYEVHPDAVGRTWCVVNSATGEVVQSGWSREDAVEYATRKNS